MKISEEVIRNITLAAINEIGDAATPELVKEVVNKTVEQLVEYPAESKKQDSFMSDSGKIILTSFGANHSGIVSNITSILARHKCDIQDITQKILQNYFTMIMIIDITDSEVTFNQLRDEMFQLSEKLNIKIFLQHEDVFRYMHRI